MKKSFPAVTVDQIQRLDRLAIDKHGIPSLVLMENAGRAVAEETRALLRRASRRRVLIVCGTGNNGGDGFVAARHLVNADADVSVYCVGRPKDLKPDAAINYKILRNCRCPIRFVRRNNSLLIREIRRADIIVDALFGVGLNRDIGEPFRSLIEAIKHAGKKIVAVDIPSGLDGTTGRVHGVCVKATTTITFSLSKKGFYRGEGPKVVGKVVVADIGIPRLLFSRVLRRRK